MTNHCKRNSCRGFLRLRRIFHPNVLINGRTCAVIRCLLSESVLRRLNVSDDFLVPILESSTCLIGISGVETMLNITRLVRSATMVTLTLSAFGVPTSDSNDEKVVAALDAEYQAAVQRNDAATMDRILADDFVLVTGRGNVFTKANLLEEARAKKLIYEHQEDSQQRVRVWGDTAVVTALLWAKGTNQGKPFEYRLWFSDTYVRTPAGWRYVFGQASIALPEVPR